MKESERKGLIDALILQQALENFDPLPVNAIALENVSTSERIDLLERMARYGLIRCLSVQHEGRLATYVELTEKGEDAANKSARRDPIAVKKAASKNILAALHATPEGQAVATHHFRPKNMSETGRDMLLVEMMARGIVSLGERRGSGRPVQIVRMTPEARANYSG